MAKRKNYNNYDPQQLLSETKHMLRNKYFNIFMNSIKWNGLEAEAEDYVMRQFWAKGTVAAFDIKNAEMVGFAPYAVSSYTMYDAPSTINLINERNVPFIPLANQTVNEDVVVGYIQRNKKSIASVVEYYVDRIAEVDMVINTNLQVHKLPMLVGVSDDDKQAAEEIIKQILNNEVAIFMSAEQLNLVKAIANGSQYIIDKLYGHAQNLENELLTYLGVDNADLSQDHLTVDQVNGNNIQINNQADGYIRELTKFCDKISEVLGYELSVESTHEQVDTVSIDNDNMAHNNDKENI